MKVKISLFLICSVALASCVDIPKFNNAPRIIYNGIDHFPDKDVLGNPVEKIIISVDFEDGDGDLGASDAERSDTVKYADKLGNYELITCTLVDNVWKETIRDSDYNKFFPDLKPDGKSGPITGKLDMNTAAPYFTNAKLVWHKWKVRIRDRSMNFSNQVQTDSIQLPSFE